LAYDGEVVTSVRYGDEDVDFRVILEQRARMSPDILAELVIPNSDGRFIRLAEVTEFLTEPGPLNIYHFDNDRAITITADIVKDLTTPMKAVEQAVVGIDLDRDWPGMRLLINGEIEEAQSSMSSLFVGFIAAVVGVYLLLVVLFNSFVQPFIVILAIPFGLIGVIAAFALHQQSLGFMSMLGVVGLTGLVVNDSLILVNLVNRLRIEEPAQTFRELIIKATQARSRPILITSITTVAGLLPMAYGIGGSDPFSAPMALAMGYGILFATPLTLVLLPCLLAVLDDVSRLYERVYQGFSQRRTAVRLGEDQSEIYLRQAVPSASYRQCETVSLTE
jgi:multidrug efflux pump subunit AcrB